MPNELNEAFRSHAKLRISENSDRWKSLRYTGMKDGASNHSLCGQIVAERKSGGMFYVNVWLDPVDAKYSLEELAAKFDKAMESLGDYLACACEYTNSEMVHCKRHFKTIPQRERLAILADLQLLYDRSEQVSTAAGVRDLIAKRMSELENQKD